MSENNLLKTLASEAESMNTSTLDKQLEAYMMGTLNDQELQELYTMAEYDADLEMQMELYKPINGQFKRDITDEIMTRFFDENDKTPNVSQINRRALIKTETNKNNLHKKIIRYFKKNYLLLVTSPALAAVFTLLIFNTQITNENTMADYSMEIFGSNQQYRNSANPSDLSTTDDKLLQFYPENQMVLILRPEHSTSEELEVNIFIEHNNKIIKLDTEQERSVFGSFKIIPELSGSPESFEQNASNLIAVISKQGSLPSMKEIRDKLADNGDRILHQDWRLLQKPIIMITNN